MFGFWKRQKDQANGGSDKARPLIAAALLSGKEFAFEPVEKLLSNLRVGRLKLKEFEIKDQILICQAGDDAVAVSLMPAPYPWTDLEGPCQTSWMWPKGTSATSVKTHQSHLLITMVGGGGAPIERHRLLTHVTAACAAQPETMGIYWPYATLVHEPKLFREIARDAGDEVPLFLWVDYRVFKNPDGTAGLFTTGLAPLGMMEIEIPSIEMSPGELREWTMNITGYLIDNGPVLKDGDTVGMTAEQKIRIRHCKSQYNRDMTVLRMEP
jgi:hypothetical protein